MSDLSVPSTNANSPHLARLIGALGEIASPGHDEADQEPTPRLADLFEKIRNAVGADLACLLESPKSQPDNSVDVKLAAGRDADRVTGLHSMLESDSANDAPQALKELGFSGRVLPLGVPEPNVKDWLGVFWSQPTKVADGIEEFLCSAAAVLKRELKHQASAQNLRQLRERLANEQLEFDVLRDVVDKQVRAEQLFRTIGETIPFGVWVADASGRPNYVSQSFLDLVGTDLEGYRALKWVNRIRDEDQEVLGRGFADAISNGKPWSAELRIRGTDNREYTILSKGSPFFDDSGNRVGYAGIQLDITDHRLAELELRRSEEQYREIVDIATEGIWKTDADKKTLFTNSSLSKLLGYSAHEFHSLLIEDMIAPECIPAFKSGWNAARAGLRNQFDCSFKCKSGENVWVLISLSPMFDRHDRFSGALIMLTDVTERHEAEANLKKAKHESDEANQAKSKFLANMSHEIRTPLSSVLGFAELLLDEDQTDAERLESVHAIRRNGQLLLNLINDILDLSKVEAGRMDIEPIAFSLENLIAEVRTIFKPQALSKNLALEVTAAEDLPPQICTDPTRLRQILFNLVGNAIKFTDEGFIKIHFARERHDLIVTVEDSGAGISKEDAQKLFSPFTQADASITRRFGGTGLGLVLSRNLARALGGDVILKKSTFGEGSTFEVRVISDLLPAESCAEATKKTRKRKLQDLDYLENLEVLLVDDSADNRLLVRRMLEPLGVKLTLAENGLRGYQIAMEKKFDLIFMDMQMPVLDGYQATERLRNAGIVQPIVALTAQAMKEERRRALKAGCTSHLSKPLTKQSLLETISECLRK